MRKKLILFDWGNIVESHTIGYSCKDAWIELFKSCGYESDNDLFDELSKYRTTAIRSIAEFEEVYKTMKTDFKLKVDFIEFQKRYYNYFKDIHYFKDVRDFEISLKDKCYIGILSNLTIFDKDRIDEQLGLNNYDYVFLSFEIGLRKPDMEIYEEVQKNIPFDKKNILFIDDNPKNIETAKKIGWNTFCATGLELDKIKKVCNEFIDDDIR